MNYNLIVALTIILTTVLLIFYRSFPFFVFSKREVPAALKFIEKLLPPMIIAVLLVYCLKDIQFTASPYGLPHSIAIAFVALIHLWKKNSMLSIFGGTILFMVLSRLL